MNKNVTIKGGVVMYGLFNDKRRATRDLDLDFIRYSLADESIKVFIDTLNLVNDGITVYVDGDILTSDNASMENFNAILKKSKC